MAAALAAFAALLYSGPASARADVSAATNYKTVVDDAGDPDLRWRVLGGDSLLELTNRTGLPVVVEGYDGEPYLWFDTGGDVFRNERSPATHLNEDRYGDVELPAAADAAAEPEWIRVAGGDRYRWHDHRAHWMVPADPVMADPGRPQVILDWEIPLQIGDRQAAAAGQLWWVPPVSWWPPVLATGALFAAVAAVAAVVTRPDRAGWPGVVRPAAGLLWILVGANAVRLFDALSASAASLRDRLVDGTVGLLVLAVLAVLGAKAWSGGPRATLALGAAATVLMVWFGLASADQLAASQVMTDLPTPVRRWTVAASCTVVVPVLIAGVGDVLARRRPRRTAAGANRR